MEKVVNQYSELTKTSEPIEQAEILVHGRLFELACKTSVCSHKLNLVPASGGEDLAAITAFSSAEKHGFST